MRFSVIFPTHQRRELILAGLRALERQELRDFEVFVVVDGSTDGTTSALRDLRTSFPLTVLEQPNAGAARARNRGAAAAHGEILLFLDDDMEAHPRLLAEHDRSHREGADVVVGHIPLHPDSPPGLLSRAVGVWAENRLRELSDPGAELTSYHLLTGQLSLSRRLFQRLDGFDVEFTREGTYGNEDLDFGQRLLETGSRIEFNPEAVSWQRYVVTPRQHLRHWRQTGAADVTFARKHPHRAAAIFAARGMGKPEFRRLFRPVLQVPGLGAFLSAILRPVVLFLTERAADESDRLFRWFRRLSMLGYWRGVREAGGIPRPRPLRVLAYHAVSDLAGDPVLGRYAVPEERFRQQLETLHRFGYNPISGNELVHFLSRRGGLPRRPVLLTFDDAYEDLARTVLPILNGTPAVTFVVSGKVGGTNDWDARRGALPLRLLSAAELREVAAGGIEIGAHSRTHPDLTRLPDDQLQREVEGSRQDLAQLGLPPPRLFAYPYGAEDERVRRAARQAGYAAGFTTAPGLVCPGRDPYRLPRIEILRQDRGWRLRLKLALAR
jgi:peptidoglycan/xylan/chitin deacetylase (PgdA/CDA1 family)/glycosyltransferase involved in cell wall biosynthesis